MTGGGGPCMVGGGPCIIGGGGGACIDGWWDGGGAGAWTMVSSRLSSMMLPDSDRDPTVSSSSPVTRVSRRPSADTGGLAKLTLLVVLAELEQVVDVFLAQGLQHNNRVTLRAR